MEKHKNVFGMQQEMSGQNPTGMTHNLLSLFMQTGRSIYLSCLFHYFSAFCFSFFHNQPRVHTPSGFPVEAEQKFLACRELRYEQKSIV